MSVNYGFPRLPRNPVLRAALLVCGVLVLAGLLAIGLVVGAAVLAAAAVLLAVRRWRLRHTAQHGDPSIIDGEFTVVTPPSAEWPRLE